MNKQDTAGSADPFVEQAEYIEPDAFNAWTEDHPHEKQILQKLCRGGAKLITGPRGCGKTTLLLKAYRRLLAPSAKGIPVYVNFKNSLRLEPLYRNHANAVYWFNQWMLFKCYSGLLKTLDELDISEQVKLRLTRREAARSAENLETGADDSVLKGQPELSIDQLVEDIESVLDVTDRVRCLLFFDDAAHAFSSEQQRDFFDFFRRIKSSRVAPKAAIYPGVTIISPTFHIGHDAEEIDVWLDPYSTEYLPFMHRLLRKRLPADIYDQFASSARLLDLVCFGSFGVPRALLNMVRGFYRDDDGEESGLVKKFNSTSALRAISASYENTIGVYSSLQHKLPLYENFIAGGEVLLDQMIQSVKNYNRGKPPNRQSVSVAIQVPVATEVERVFGFLQYAGLVMYEKKVSRGVKGRFEIYRVHAGGLIDRNALLGRRSVRADLFSKALQTRNAHEFTRITPARLWKVNDVRDLLTLALPPCQNCGTPRASETARFCLNCGSPLTAVSTFRQLVKREISDLPISEKMIARIRRHSSIRTIGDVLMDHEHRQLRSVKWIGPYRANRIYSYAEEYIA